MALNYDPEKSYQNNYFVSMLRRYPDGNFVWYLKPDQIQKSAKERIFREMIKGQIDYSLYGKYFQDTKFLENVFIAAKDELNNNTTIMNALAFQDQCMPGHVDVENLLSRYRNLTYVFQIIVSRLENVKFTGNVGALTDIQYTLANYKNIL